MTPHLKGLLERLDRIGRFAEDVALVSLLSGMILLAVGQIGLRELLGTGIVWADELVKLMVLWLAMIGSIAACRDNRHIRIDVFSHILPARLILATRIVVDIFAATVCAIIAWQAYRYLQLEIEFGDVVLVDTPAWLAHSVVPIAFALSAYRFLILVFRHIGDLIAGNSPVIR